MYNYINIFQRVVVRDIQKAGISCLEHDDEYEKEEDENRNSNSRAILFGAFRDPL